MAAPNAYPANQEVNEQPPVQVAPQGQLPEAFGVVPQGQVPESYDPYAAEQERVLGEQGVDPATATPQEIAAAAGQISAQRSESLEQADAAATAGRRRLGRRAL